eukprot:m.136399 g.136399  ORF g.136399 m.136399 type:complete len:84 (+) comp16585_c0_seq1:490-741(+)
MHTAQLQGKCLKIPLEKWRVKSNKRKKERERRTLAFIYRMWENMFKAEWASTVERDLLKTFQKRSVSSPAPVTMVWPSGDMAR